MSHVLFLPLLTVSTTVSCLVAGCLFSLSYVSTAAILSSPRATETVVLTQWRTVFNRGFHLCPVPSIATSLLCFLNAFMARQGDPSRGSYIWPLVAQGIFLIGIVPFTLTFIIGVEEDILSKETRLRKKAEQQQQQDHEKKKLKPRLDNGNAETESFEETKKMLAEWNTLNYYRTCLPLIAAGIGWGVWWDSSSLSNVA